MNDTPPTNPTAADARRLDDLLADRAVFGLDTEENQELERLLAAAGLSADDTRYDLPAASVAVAETVADVNLPATLRSRVLAAHADTKAVPGALDPSRAVSHSPWARFALVGTAVAAGLMISAFLGPARDSIEASRAALIADAKDLVRIAWTAQEDPAVEPGREGDAPYGDVVWSDAAQSGYLRFRGLRPNDPSVEQYQLWVFDEARKAEHPVDGGVFDVAAGSAFADGEFIVPINAKLPVTRATLFAITVEKPGGVVVSDRLRLPLLAQR